jgi:hypothetical protein
MPVAKLPDPFDRFRLRAINMQELALNEEQLSTQVSSWTRIFVLTTLTHPGCPWRMIASTSAASVT